MSFRPLKVWGTFVLGVGHLATATLSKMVCSGVGSISKHSGIVMPL